MNLCPLGLDADTWGPLAGSLDELDFADRVAGALGDNVAALRTTTAVPKGDLLRASTVDLGDPRAAGWTFLVSADDPDRVEIVEILRPLAEHRAMADPSSPLVHGGEDDWFDWTTRHVTGVPAGDRPHYVLLAGGPTRLPFGFQSFLDTVASTGRVAFDTLDDLRAYVEKLLRLESAAEAAATNSALFFAPDGNAPDPTAYSRRHMVEPLSRIVADGGVFHVTTVAGDEATKDRLVDVLHGATPALVYTASHGLADVHGDPARQRQLHGAICCQRAGAERALKDWVFTADDVPAGEEPFLEGSVFFQFACYGYGTPADSDFAHWKLGVAPTNTTEDFVAALPKRLLAHPRGPVGFIGHVDLAWLHGFDDPDAPGLAERWHPRLAPFVSAVRTLLDRQPPGLAMADMHLRYAAGNAQLANTYDRIERGRLKLTDENRPALAATFLTRSDAQNHLVFGDPAAAVRVRAPD